MKYGALSNETGKIHIAWEAGRPGSDDGFRLNWREVGGPKIRPSRRKGFGSRVIERVLADDFQGRVSLDFRETGLVCELTAQMLHLDENPSGNSETGVDVNERGRGRCV